jgi:hypothetical protein
MVRAIVGLDGDRFTDQIDGGVISAGLRCDQAEAMEGVGVGGVIGEDLAVEALRF